MGDGHACSLIVHDLPAYKTWRKAAVLQLATIPAAYRGLHALVSASTCEMAGAGPAVPFWMWHSATPMSMMGHQTAIPWPCPDNPFVMPWAGPRGGGGGGGGSSKDKPLQKYQPTSQQHGSGSLPAEKYMGHALQHLASGELVPGLQQVVLDPGSPHRVRQNEADHSQWLQAGWAQWGPTRTRHSLCCPLWYPTIADQHCCEFDQAVRDSQRPKPSMKGSVTTIIILMQL